MLSEKEYQAIRVAVWAAQRAQTAEIELAQKLLANAPHAPIDVPSAMTFARVLHDHIAATNQLLEALVPVMRLERPAPAN